MHICRTSFFTAEDDEEVGIFIALVGSIWFVSFSFDKANMKQSIKNTEEYLDEGVSERLNIDVNSSELPNDSAKQTICFYGIVGYVIGCAINTLLNAQTAHFQPGSSWPVIGPTILYDCIPIYGDKNDWDVSDKRLIKNFNLALMLLDGGYYTIHVINSKDQLIKFLSTEEFRVIGNDDLRLELLEDIILPTYSPYEKYDVDGCVANLIAQAYLYGSVVRAEMDKFGDLSNSGAVQELPNGILLSLS